MTKDVPDNDHDLFRQHIGEIKPVINTKVVHPRQRKKLVKRTEVEEIDLPKDFVDKLEAVKNEDSLYFARSGVQFKQLKKLRQGKFICQAECDLHGLTRAQAEQTLTLFIDHCLQQQYRYIRLIHGKGYRSEQQQPVLKNYLNHALREFVDVLAFCSALPKDGGQGAVYVLLRSQQAED